ALGSMAVEAPLLKWVAIHRRHHQHSDRPDDPHSPHGHGGGILGLLRGVWHAHLGWMFRPDPPDLPHYVKDLRQDTPVRVANAVFGVLALGEGWHNNHHAFPTSARHGLRWWQFDLSYYVIRALALLGLAWNVKLPATQPPAPQTA